MLDPFSKCLWLFFEEIKNMRWIWFCTEFSRLHWPFYEQRLENVTKLYKITVEPVKLMSVLPV